MFKTEDQHDFNQLRYGVVWGHIKIHNVWVSSIFLQNKSPYMSKAEDQHGFNQLRYGVVSGHTEIHSLGFVNDLAVLSTESYPQIGTK